jgi:hypothetical protein
MSAGDARNEALDDREFLGAFEEVSIPSDRWTHRDHVRMAFLYLSEHAFEDALDRIRAGVRALNRANGVPENATSGYHETVTVAWARLIASCIAYHGGAESFDGFAAANPHLCARTLLRAYYTRGRVLTSEARSRFVAPDIAPLPPLPPPTSQ